ncbi:MAG: hypothetical protein K2J08_06820 [Ruminococcus sp.]|nr:hypothetical protein [Ruminococcus sp.]
MSFCIEDGKNGGYPRIAELAEFPDISFKKPYGINFLVCDENRNNGYPSMMCMGKFPDKHMNVPYPHGSFICKGEDFNNGYPFIPEITGVGIKCESSLFYGEKPVHEIYYNGQYITTAYCNGQKVFNLEYRKL